MKKKILPIVLIVVAVAFCIVSFMILPNTVIVQIGADGQASNTMPKLFAVAIPFAITAGGAVFYMIGKEDSSKKSLIVSVVGIAVFILMFVFNH